VWIIQGREPLIGGVRLINATNGKAVPRACRPETAMLIGHSCPRVLVKFLHAPLLMVSLTGTLDVPHASAGELPADTSLIESLTPNQAEALAQRDRDLDLDGLTEMSAETAQRLAQHKGNLYLNGLTTLSEEVARALAEHEGALLLDGLTTLSDETAKALSKYKGFLHLSGVTTLSDEAIVFLAQSNCRFLGLSGLTAISDEVAGALARHEGGLSLSGLATISDNAAHSLGQHSGVLNLNGLTTLSDEAARSLGQHSGVLNLKGLETLSGDAATALARHTGDFSLGGLKMLSPEVAKALAAAEKWDGRLLRITAFDSPDSVAIAKALATRKGTLALPNLKKLSPKTLLALIEKEDIEIPLVETLELIDEPDGSSGDDFVIPESFQKRQQLQK
jgi:hypothetical protein